ncbi:uncharacterized protein LOC118187438 [Stegodyphus dumicola]|uniref:uncharacterized protein LOC118187438 n=1 Tax=Stegodyphus dumicola TaxID=202533 RepID=UPI0015B13657|nr:uncharacterized protein LOC118187438 [Stegodyphus dumicola]
MTNLIQKSAFILFQRLIRLPSNPHWRNYDYNKQRNLKTQNGFLLCVSRLEQYNHIRTLKPYCCLLLYPLDYSFFDVRLDLEMKVDKKEMSPEQLRTIAFETIKQRFPVEEWIHVYTDGCLTDRIQVAGAGVFSKLFSFYIPVGGYSTHFDGELKAIHVALQQLSLRQSSFGRVVVLPDSTSALQAISSYQECKNICVKQCQEVIKELSLKISFQWVPSHCGIYGNVMADMLAKKGGTVLQKPKTSASLPSIKLLTSPTCQKTFRDFATRAL